MLDAGLYSALLAAAALLQWRALVDLGPRRIIGDELDYLRRALRQDAHSPEPFLRVPWMAWMAVLGRRHSKGPELALRFSSAVASVLTVALTGGAGWALGGPRLGWVAAALLLLSPERLLLGCHIFPDNFLALWMAALNLVLVAPHSDATVPLLGLLCAAAFLTRFEYVALWLFTALALHLEWESLTVTRWAFLVLPTLAAALILSLRNYAKYRLPVPDNTPFFNLIYLGAEIQERNRKRAIEPFALEVIDSWYPMTEPDRRRAAARALRVMALHPLRLLLGITGRLLALVGRETFVSQRILTVTGACPGIASSGWRGRALLTASRLLLPVYFQLLLAAAAVAVLTSTRTPLIVWPAAGVFLVTVLIHVRSRYRLSLMPTLCLLAAQFVVRPVDTSSQLTTAQAVGTLILCALLLLWSPRRVEDDPAAAVT